VQAVTLAIDSPLATSDPALAEVLRSEGGKSTLSQTATADGPRAAGNPAVALSRTAARNPCRSVTKEPDYPPE
jgi:hypothetical protein